MTEWRCMSNSCVPGSRPTERTRAAPGELLHRARTSRRQLLGFADRSRCSVERDLAYDVRYDCALIRLCAVSGITTTPDCLRATAVERTRLEHALAETGMDLT